MRHYITDALALVVLVASIAFILSHAKDGDVASLIARTFSFDTSRQ